MVPAASMRMDVMRIVLALSMPEGMGRSGLWVLSNLASMASPRKHPPM